MNDDLPAAPRAAAAAPTNDAPYPLDTVARQLPPVAHLPLGRQAPHAEQHPLALVPARISGSIRRGGKVAKCESG